MRQPPVPNRLATVPPDLYEQIERVLVNEHNYNQAVQIKRLKKVVGIAYREGYMDGYRDGHTDAENGHDERVRAHVNSLREEIVRCRDCKAFLEGATPNDVEQPHFCTLHGTDLAEPDGFCAWGERA